MKIGVPAETLTDERRVALVPGVIGLLVKSGHEILVEEGAGGQGGLPGSGIPRSGRRPGCQP